MKILKRFFVRKRYFIFFFSCKNNGRTSIGNTVIETKGVLPSNKELKDVIQKNSVGNTDIIITSFNEITKKDYLSWSS